MRQILAVVVLLSALVANAGKVVEDRDTITARQAFEELPLQYIELLPLNTRLDMLDYFEADSVYHATNALQGKSWIERLTPTYIRVRVTDVSTLELKVLTGKRQTVAMSYTIAGPARDSELRFFNEEMQPLRTDKVMKLPRLVEFIDKERLKATGVTFGEVEAMIPFPAVEYTFSPEGEDLVATLRVDDLMGQESVTKISPALRPRLTYRWTGTAYRP